MAVSHSSMETDFSEKQRDAAAGTAIEGASEHSRPASTRSSTMVPGAEHDTDLKKAATATPGIPNDARESRADKTGEELSENPQHEYLSGVRLVLILASVTLVFFLVMLDASIVATAIPQITSDFDSLLDVGWYGSAYILANSSFQPMSGKIYTYFRTKWSFLAFFFVFQLGSALCGAAQSSTTLIVSRAVAGLGAAGLLNGAFTILAAILPPQRQPAVMGINVALGQLGIACGPLIGGAFTEYASWRWCFYLNLPCGAVAGIFFLMLDIPEVDKKPAAREVLRTAVRKLDLVGFALVAPAVIMLLLALQWGGNRYAWDGSTVVGLIVGSAVTFVVFLAWERRAGDDAMLPFSLLRQRIIWSASATMFFFMAVLFCSNYYLPIYFQAVRDDSALTSGVHMLPSILGQVVFSVITGGSVQRFGYYLPWILTGTAFDSIAFGLLSTLGPSTSVSRRVGYQVLFGIGAGMSASISYMAIQNLVKAAQIPVAMGIVIFCQNLGGAVFLTVGQTIFTNSLRDTVRQYAPGVDPERILAVGARSFRPLVSPDQLPGVLQAYSKSVDRVMYLGIGLAIASWMFAWGLGWKDVRKQNDNKAKSSPPSEGAESDKLEV